MVMDTNASPALGKILFDFKVLNEFRHTHSFLIPVIHSCLFLSFDTLTGLSCLFARMRIG